MFGFLFYFHLELGRDVFGFLFYFHCELGREKIFCFGKENGYGMGGHHDYFVKDTKNGRDHC